MKELDLLVENYFTPALDATDILRLVEQMMLEQPEIILEGETDQIDINEIWTAYVFAGKDWGKVRSGDVFGNPKAHMEAREKELIESFGNDSASEIIAMQKGRAEAAADAVKAYAAANGFPPAVEFVAWTARPSMLKLAYGKEISKNNPADILIKFENPELDTFLGVSLKSTKMPTGTVEFGNFGGNYVFDSEKRPFPLGLGDKGGKEAWDLISKHREKTLTNVAKEATELLKDSGFQVPAGQGAKGEFHKRLVRTYMGDDGLSNELQSRKPDSWTKEEPISNLSSGRARWISKIFYDAGYEHTSYYRDRVIDVLQTLDKKELQEHVLVALYRTDAIPVTIVATGRGSEKPFTADISENPSDPEWLKEVATDGFSIKKSGINIISIEPASGGNRIVSIRMKWMDRPFASSVKPSIAK
jgi:hypothetical protein